MRWAVAIGCGLGMLAFAAMFRGLLEPWGLPVAALSAFALGFARHRLAHWFIAVGLSFVLVVLAIAGRWVPFAPLALLPIASVATHAWLEAAARPVRPGSLMAGAQVRQILFRAAAVVFSFSVLGEVVRHHAVLELALLLSFVAMALLWAVTTSSVGNLLDLGARIRPVDGATPRAGGREIDVGDGDEVYLVDAKVGAAYRGIMAGSGSVIGDLHGLTRQVWDHVRASGAFVAVSLAALVLVARPSPSAPSPPLYDPPFGRPGVGEEAHVPASTQKSLGWYPQDEPIVVDINGDGVDDVVGLRWDWSADAAPLVVVANDGVTFGRLWQTGGFPSQWGSSHTELVLSGQHLFMTDSEGQLRVLDLKTGVITAQKSWKRAYQICAAKSGPDRAWLAAEDDDYDKGWIVGVDLGMVAEKRTDWCTRDLPKCGKDSGTGLCRPWPAPSFVSQERSFVTLTQTSTHGVAVVGKAKAGREAETVIAYDPRTLQKRWERPLALTDEPLHASPGISHQQEGNVIYVKYQLKDGSWRFGARDLDSGEVLWSQNPPNAAIGSHVPSMFVKSSRLYVRVDTDLQVVDGKTGKKLGVVR